MRTLNIQNADCTFTTTAGSYSLVSNVTYQYSNRPAELDLPSGSWFLWPLRQGTLVMEQILPPGTAPVDIPLTLTPTTVTITSNAYLTGGGVITLVTDAAFLSGIQISTQQVPGLAMPVLQQVLTYTILVDDDGAT